MSAITAKASRKMKKYAVLTKEPRCFLGSFDFSWEQRKLGELALFNPKDELPQTFEYVDLESVVGTEMLSHRTEAKLSAPSRAQRLAHTGDLFYQTVRPYQKNNYLFEKPDNNYVFSTGYAQMRPYVDGYFLLSLVQSDRFVKVVLDNCTGTSYPAINANDLAKIEVTAPSDENEAQKIGTIFRNIDNLITLHQRKFEKLTNVKKSMLEKMFPQNGSSYPEIRFKGFTDPWEQRKAKELFISTADKGYPDLPVLSATQDRGMIRRDENSINIFHDKKNEAGYKRVLPGQFVIHLRSFQGGFAHSTIEGITSPAYTVFGFSEPEKHDSEYWKYVFTSKAFIRRLETVTYGIRDGRSISYDEFLTLGFAYPSKAEQTAIARYLDKLSDLITLHQRKPFLMKWRTSDANRNQTNRLVL